MQATARLATALFVCVWLAAAPPASAASDVRLTHAPDGTLLVVGRGWHQGPLVVNLGRLQFATYADAAGDFEIATGLQTYEGELTVHHVSEPVLAMAPLPLAATQPFAALLAQAVVEGLGLLAIATSIGVLATGITRRLTGYPRR